MKKLTIELDDELYLELKIDSQKNKRSLMRQIEWILQEYIWDGVFEHEDDDFNNDKINSDQNGKIN